jgi:putative DNA primase/helicase
MHEHYFEAAIRDEVRNVVEARRGARNSQLNSAAFSLASLGIPEQRIYEALIPAAERCALVKDDGMKAVRATIASGMKAGYSHPRQAQWPGGFGGSSYRQQPQTA